jgi:hypothetical protein
MCFNEINILISVSLKYIITIFTINPISYINRKLHFRYCKDEYFITDIVNSLSIGASNISNKIKELAYPYIYHKGMEL